MAQDERDGLDRLRRKPWLAFAENLYALANRHRENQDYVVAHALYGRALEAAGKVAVSADASLAARIRGDQQAVFEMLPGREEGWEKVESEDLQLVGG